MESKLYAVLVTLGPSAGVKYRHGVALVSWKLKTINLMMAMNWPKRVVG